MKFRLRLKKIVTILRQKSTGKRRYKDIVESESKNWQFLETFTLTSLFLTRQTMLIDVACPFDTRIVQKDAEKIDHYNYELTYEIRRIWNCKKVLIIPNAIGILGLVSQNFCGCMSKFGIEVSTYCLHKARIIG